MSGANKNQVALGAEEKEAVSAEDVRRITELARLRPDKEALRRLTKELNGILGHVHVLEALELSELSDESPVPEDSIPSRDPAMGPDRLPVDSPRAIAPDWEEGFFVVPRLPALSPDSSSEDSADR